VAKNLKVVGNYKSSATPEGLLFVQLVEIFQLVDAAGITGNGQQLFIIDVVGNSNGEGDGPRE